MADFKTASQLLGGFSSVCPVRGLALSIEDRARTPGAANFADYLVSISLFGGKARVILNWVEGKLKTLCVCV